MQTWGKGKQGDPAVDAISARTALRDAYLAQRDLAQAVGDNNHQRTRMSWITCMTLLRAVGHVLNKVDAQRSPWLKAASDSQFKKCKADAFGNLIFHEFIEAERNVVLKEYKASIFDRESDADGKERLVVRDILIGVDVYAPATAIAEAIKWWERYLEHVETAAVEARRAKGRR